MSANDGGYWPARAGRTGPSGAPAGRPYPRRHPRQHHALLADNTGISSARLYWENKSDFFDAKNISIPFAISVFPDELYQAPRSWAERAYPHHLIYYNQVDKGGHFAAWEQPDLFAAEIRAAFRSLR